MVVLVVEAIVTFLKAPEAVEPIVEVCVPPSKTTVPVELNTVEAPVMEMLPERVNVPCNPRTVPPVCVKFPDVETAAVPATNVPPPMLMPVEPAYKLPVPSRREPAHAVLNRRPPTDTALRICTVVPLVLKIAVSDAPGTLAPVAPFGRADQLVVSSQRSPVPPQYRSAACALAVKRKNPATTRNTTLPVLR